LLRICSHCGATTSNNHFTRCMDCGAELDVSYSSDIKIEQENTVKSIRPERVYAGFYQLGFVDGCSDEEENIPVKVMDLSQNCDDIFWPAEMMPELIEGIPVPKKEPRPATKPLPQFIKKATSKMRFQYKVLTEKQRAHRNAIVLALLLGWCGAHRQYIGDSETFRSYLLFGVFGGLLTAGVTTVFAQMVAWWDAYQLLTGRMEINLEQTVHFKPPQTVFSQPNI